MSAAQKAESTEPKVVAGEVETGSPVEPRMDAAAAEEFTDPAAEKPAQTVTRPEGYITPYDMRPSMEMQTNERLEEIVKESEKSPTSPHSSKGVKGWLKTKFARRQSKPRKLDSKEAGNDKDLAGGAALAEAGHTYTEPPNSSVGEATFVIASTQDENTGEKGTKTVDENIGETLGEERLGRSIRRASSVSPVSPLDENIELGKESTGDEEFEEAQDHFDNDLAPPPTFAITKLASPVPDSKFHEEI